MDSGCARVRVIDNNVEGVRSRGERSAWTKSRARHEVPSTRWNDIAVNGGIVQSSARDPLPLTSERPLARITPRGILLLQERMNNTGQELLTCIEPVRPRGGVSARGRVGKKLVCVGGGRRNKFEEQKRLAKCRVTRTSAHLLTSKRSTSRSHTGIRAHTRVGRYTSSRSRTH